MQEARWYVVHTFSGYENKVKANLEKIIENRNLQEMIQEIQVPMEEVIVEKNNKKKTVMRKIFPGYIIVKMVMTDDSWYVVRNTRGVTGFVGPGSKPIPLSDDEIISMGIESGIPVLDYEVGDSVKVLDGPLENFIGVVEHIDHEKRKVVVNVSMFGRETPVDLEYNQIEPLR